jgi:hypothetical protein
MLEIFKYFSEVGGRQCPSLPYKKKPTIVNKGLLVLCRLELEKSIDRLCLAVSSSSRVPSVPTPEDRR